MSNEKYELMGPAGVNISRRWRNYIGDGCVEAGKRAGVSQRYREVIERQRMGGERLAIGGSLTVGRPDCNDARTMINSRL